MTGPHTAMAVTLALGAAAAFAVSNVAQMDAVRRQPAGRRTVGGSQVDPGLVVRAARDPLWLAGLAASIIGFGLEATALSVAPVVLVQPLIVAELPFALPLAAFLAGKRLGFREWSGIVLVTAGLATVVTTIHPADTLIAAGPVVWLVLFAAVGLAVAGLVGLTGRATGVARTSALAAAAGFTFGLLSVVTKATTHQFATRGLGALGTWQPWALAVIGMVGMSLAQNTYRAGPLAVSLPLLDIGEPLAGSVIAIVAFGEGLGHLGPAGMVAFAVGLACIGSGVAVLDRSPLVQAAQAAQTARVEQSALSARSEPSALNCS